MRRVLVIGVSGSGKTTVAKAAAARLGLPHVELDALQHGPNWTIRPTFAADVERATAGSAWVADGNYREVRELLWARADTVVWIDPPRWLSEWQVVWRSVSRAVTRQELWNGNRERWLTMARASHPIRWSWRKHREYRRRYTQMFAEPPNDEVALIRLGSRQAVADWLGGL